MKASSMYIFVSSTVIPFRFEINSFFSDMALCATCSIIVVQSSPTLCGSPQEVLLLSCPSLFLHGSTEVRRQRYELYVYINVTSLVISYALG